MMPAPTLHPAPAWAARRLALVRTLAWALLFAGWLVLGELGHLHLAQWAGGLLPVALWLAGIGALLALAARRPPPAWAVHLALVAAGVALALALSVADRGVPAVLLAALAWAVLLVALSMAVRALRAAQAGVPPAPLLPALAGAVLAWGAQGSLATLLLVASAVALTVTALLCSRATRGDQRLSACRAGLFDCSLPLPSIAAWRHSGDWPQHAAALVMLPMMAALPAMNGWCGAASGGLGKLSAWHLGAMVLPALCLRRGLAQVSHSTLNAGLATLLVAGAMALLAWPDLNGLMLAALLHTMAWSLAWAAPMLARGAVERREAALRAPPAVATLSQAGLIATAMLLLGLALDRYGPQALAMVHMALAGLALVGLLLAWCGRGGAAARPLEGRS